MILLDRGELLTVFADLVFQFLQQYKAVMRELRSVINAQKAPRETRKKTPAEAKLWAVWYNELCPLLQPHQRNVHYLAGIIERRLARRVLDGERLLTALLDPAELHTAIEALKSAANSRKYTSTPSRRSRVQKDPVSPAPPAPADPPVLNEYGNDLQAHPELADVPF